MDIGIVGLGRMGGNIARRLMGGGHSCTVFDRDPKAVTVLEKEGATAASSLEDMVHRLKSPRAIWLMLPAGEITENAVTQFGSLLKVGDTVIDGGNTMYKDDVRRAQVLAAKGIHYLDAGTSGGIWGLERGYCLMIGGDTGEVKRLDPIFAALAPGGTGSMAERGYIHCGPAGSGHFVKMIHNGIEYGLMEAYAEGFDILRHAASEARAEDERFTLDLAAIAEVWRHGSVVSSWLLDLIALALSEDPKLSRYEGIVADSGEGRWTVEAAIEAAVPADVLSAALYARFRSRDSERFSGKLLSAMRAKFGGHVEPKGED